MRRNPAVVIHLLITLLCTVVLYFGYAAPNLAEASFVASWLFLALTCWAIFSWYNLTRDLLDLYLLFLIFLVLLNGGQVLLHALGQMPSGILTERFTPETKFRAIAVVMMCIAGLHLGALSGYRQAPTNIVGQSSNEDACRLVGLAFIWLATPFAAYMAMKAVALVATGGYFALYQVEAPTGLLAFPRAISSFLLPGVLFLVAGSAKFQRYRLMGTAVLVAYALTLLFLGFRSHSILPLIALAWLWHHRIGHIPKGVAVAAALVFFIIVAPLIKAVRNIPGGERLSISVLADAYGGIGRPAFDIVHELGGSMGTIAHTIDLTDGPWVYELGATYWRALLTVVPNLFWDIHPSVVAAPHARLVWEVEPVIAAAGGGLGYSPIAEAYLNFGFMGAVIVCTVFGWIIVRASNWAVHSGDSAKLAFLASVVPMLLFATRSDAILLVRPIIWYSFVPFAAVGIAKFTLSKPAGEKKKAPSGDSE